MTNLEKNFNAIYDAVKHLCGQHNLQCDKCPFGKKEFDCHVRKDTLKWLLSQVKEPILDEVEKEYLENILKPFKNKVEYISKETTFKKLEYLYINFEDDYLALPTFKMQAMYRGMKPFKEYTLKELGLFEVEE